MSNIRIEALRSLAAIAPLRTRIDALNAVARRPCPFSTFEYIQTFLSRDEYWVGDERVLFLAAFDGEALVGYLPLRKYRDRIAGIPYGRIGVLVSHDTDRPHAVARAEDEARCCDAFYRYLLEEERGWSFIELAMQDEASGLDKLPPMNPLRFYTRRFENMPNTTVPLGFDSFADYFASLANAQRHNQARLCRKFLASGNVEFVTSSDPRARLPLLELYLDLESRSWKEKAHAGIRRSPRRIEFFRALCDASQPLEIEVDLVLIDDLPVSGLVSGAFQGGMYGIEMAFDQDYEDVAPGHLLTLMSLYHAMSGGYRSYNFDGNYAYYKARMGGVVTTTNAVQIYRVGSLPWLKARAGEIKRRIKPPAQDVSYNPERRRVSGHDEGADANKEAREPDKGPPPRPARVEERGRTRATLRALEADGARIERFSKAAIEEAMPFSTRREKPSTPPKKAPKANGAPRPPAPR